MGTPSKLELALAYLHDWGIYESTAELFKETGENTFGWIYITSGRLAKGRKYHFDGWDVGRFTLEGGATGSFSVEVYQHPGVVKISDEYGRVKWSHCENIGDRITILDHKSGDFSRVILTRAGKRCTAAPGKTIPVRVHYPKEPVYLSGARDFEVTGKGCCLKVVGSGRVVVTEDVSKVEQEEGPGSVEIQGTVTGDVVQSDKVRLIVRGNVLGKVTQEGSGQIGITGFVGGDIEQKGNGVVNVRGGHLGRVLRRGNGVVNVVNANVVGQAALGGSGGPAAKSS